MAKNDMDEIAYKILKYLYEKMKTGNPCRLEDFCWESQLFTIPKPYWKNIIQELLDNEFIKGITIVSSIDGEISFVLNDPSITLKGCEYLKDNSRMKKVEKYLGKPFEILIDNLIR